METEMEMEMEMEMCIRIHTHTCTITHQRNATYQMRRIHAKLVEIGCLLRCFCRPIASHIEIGVWQLDRDQNLSLFDVCVTIVRVVLVLVAFVFWWLLVFPFAFIMPVWGERVMDRPWYRRR